VTTGYLPRHADPALARAVATFPIVMVDGPRGVGKTTTAMRIAASVLRLPEDLERLAVAPAQLLSNLTPPVLIDEWQLAGTDLLWTLKSIVDADPTPGRFILAGSVEPRSYGPTYPLTGRVGQVLMRPMTRAELAGTGDRPVLLEQLFDGTPPQPTAGVGSEFSLSDLLRTGFPGARSLADPTLFLESYAAMVAQRAGDEGRDASRLARTMRVLATLEASAVPDQAIWEAADINKATWKAYDDLLVRTHLAVPTPAFGTNRLKRLTVYPKRHLADTSLALALVGVGAEVLGADPKLAGRYVESHALQQLRPQIDVARATLSHLRTAGGGREIDAVIERGDQVVAVEVKLKARPSVADAVHIVWLRDQLGTRFRLGLVVHTGGDVVELADRIVAVPITMLAG
jgi:hypothetical protein